MEKCGILIIHGFGGNLSEVDNLKVFFESKGYTVRCPILAGHMMGKSEFRKSNYHQWISSAENVLIDMKKQCEDVFIIGFSMGGLVGINLVLKHNIKGIGTLNTPIYYWDFKVVIKNILSDIKNKKLNYVSKYIKATVLTPFNSMINFKSLLKITKENLNLINIPMFVGQGLLDDTTKHGSGEYIVKNISSKKYQLKYYKNSDHLICNSKDKENVFTDLNSFIEDLM